MNKTGDATVKQKRSADQKKPFYASLESFVDFTAVTDLSKYHPAPDDWLVVIADISGSTDAILEGRYKDVNMVGAATITAVVNVTRPHDIPYVFGGDGATLLIPPQALPRVRQALLKTQALAKTEFGLSLRIGAVPVHRVRNEHVDVLVAKYQLSPGNYLAMFNGGGVGLVDKLIKADDGTRGYLIQDESIEGELDLGGLSCRWEPLAARRGVMLSMLIQALSDDHEDATAVYRDVMARLDTVLGAATENAKPISVQNMRFSWPPKGLKLEAKSTCGDGHYVPRLIYLYCETLFQLCLQTFGLKVGGYDAPVYQSELIDNSDFRRFDDTMRIVLDCTMDEVRGIERVLAEFRNAGSIAYGLHEADSALMTCLVFSLTDSEHVHFIDGGDGGFSIAARQLKQQLAESSAK